MASRRSPPGSPPEVRDLEDLALRALYMVAGAFRDRGMKNADGSVVLGADGSPLIVKSLGTLRREIEDHLGADAVQLVFAEDSRLASYEEACERFRDLGYDAGDAAVAAVFLSSPFARWTSAPFPLADELERAAVVVEREATAADVAASEWLSPRLPAGAKLTPAGEKRRDDLARLQDEADLFRRCVERLTARAAALRSNRNYPPVRQRDGAPSDAVLSALVHWLRRRRADGSPQIPWLRVARIVERLQKESVLRPLLPGKASEGALRRRHERYLKRVSRSRI